MAAFEATDITKVFGAPNGMGGAVLPVGETPTGGMQNIQLGPGGGLLVEPASGVDVATETTQTLIAGATIPATPTGVITKSDVTVYDPPIRWLQVTGAGVVTVMLSGSLTAVLPVTMAAGQIETGLIISRVMSTGTTATGITGAA